MIVMGSQGLPITLSGNTEQRAPQAEGNTAPDKLAAGNRQS